MTPLLSGSTIALAQRNAATSMVTRRGALALQRPSLVEAQRVRTRAAAKQQHQTTAMDTMALEEQNRKADFGNGDRDGGVGR